MRYLWGGLSLLFFFGAIALFVGVLFAGRNGTIFSELFGSVNGTVLVVAAFVVLLLSYFSRRIARRYP